MIARGTISHWVAPRRSVLIGLSFFLLGSLSDFWLQRHVGSLPVALLDDAIVGIGAGVLVFLYERQQGRSISQRKQAENAARESEERFRLVADSAPVLIWMSGPDKLCNYFNQSWLEFTGRELEAELGNGWAEGVHPEDLERCLGTYRRAFDQREPFQMEYRLRRRDGEHRWVLDLGVPRFDADGSFAGYIGSAVDITQHKQAEEALSGVSRRLIEAHEEERTWIARELHDDINQRIALVSIALETLRLDVRASDLKTSRRIEEACGHVKDLASDIQALSHRLHSSKLEYLGLVGASNGFCKEISERHNVEVAFQSQDMPRQLPDEVSLCLFRVLQEAIQNAVRHSGTRQFEVSLQGALGEIHLNVHDSGVGFDPEKTISGNGLGLVSIRERLKMVDGELSIESKPSLGTTIHARVPLGEMKPESEQSQQNVVSGKMQDG